MKYFPIPSSLALEEIATVNNEILIPISIIIMAKNSLYSEKRKV
jgi:hypothetical protein